ncbi:MAG: class I SAM-dependent methyltransferase [Pseudomonadales bacterium]|nr:class I SAM-dependent methyltransferase [Pseudomonadales bacterium]
MIRIFSTEAETERAGKAASKLGMSVDISCSRPSVDSGFFLWAHDGRLELGFEKESLTAYADLNAVRAKLKSGNKLHLARSLGIDKHPKLNILDAMAGFGMDAMVMLGMGARVQMLERSPVMFVLLCDALDRLGICESEFSIQCTDAIEQLKLLSGENSEIAEKAHSVKRYDVIYLDPMFPGRNKKALPNRRAQLLARLLPFAENNQSELSLANVIAMARRFAVKRVVLKRRRTDPEVLKPDWKVVGRTIRYDVYRGLGGA